MVATLERGLAHPERAGRRRRGGRVIIAVLALAVIVAGIALVVVGDGGAKDPVHEANKRVETLYAAWEAEDAEAILGFLSRDFRAYDADANPDPGYSTSEAIRQVRNPSWWDAWDVEVGKHFVSPDGRFAAVLSTFAITGAEPKPAVALIAFRGDKLMWSFDYYGGPSKTDGTVTMNITPSGLEPGSAAARAAVAAATDTLQTWLEAFNGRDADRYLAAYARDATYVDVVSPTWRRLTGDEFESDVRARFGDGGFRSTLGPSPASPIDSFFVSADGRYAAAQGTSLETGTVRGRPMVVLLELDNGTIVAQYNFISHG